MVDGWDDDELLMRLRQAIEARKAVPPGFAEAAKNAFAWHNIDAELARLTYDSTEGRGLVAATRSEAASIRALAFTHPRLTIELEITVESVLGQIAPVQNATIEVQTHAGPEPVISTDEIGCFSIQPIPRGPFRLRCRAGPDIDVLTGWITLLFGSCRAPGNYAISELAARSRS
jgi:hypothetical protein